MLHNTSMLKVNEQKPIRNRPMVPGDLGYHLLVIPPFVVLFMLTVFPFIFSLIISLLHWNLAEPNNIRFIGFGNFHQMITTYDFWHSVFLTIYQIGVSIIVELILGMCVALLFVRKMKGINLLRSFYLVPMMITPIVAGLVWRMLLSTNMGFVNYVLSLIGIHPIDWLGSPHWAMISIIISDVWLDTPFVSMILLAGLLSLPSDVFEAGKIDGANPFQVFRYVTIPLLKPMIWLALLFRVMDAIRKFDTIYVMTAGGPGNSTETLNLYTYYNAFQYLNIGYSSALSIVMLVIMLVCSIFILRRIQRDQL